MGNQPNPTITEIGLAVLERIPAMVAYWNRDQICLFANNAYRDWFGKAPEQIIGKSMEELLGPLYRMNLPHIQAVLQGEEQVFERTIPNPRGGVRYSIATYTPDTVDGEVRGFFVHVADVSPLKKLEHELQAARARAEELATRAPLTGLPNRLLLEERIAKAITSRSDGESVALMALDLDHFKQINDEYGHQAGDALLRTIAQRLLRAARKSDTVVRLGGDEFVILAPHLGSQASVVRLAERILAAVQQPTYFGTAIVNPTLSIGIALCPKHGESCQELLVRSDLAMYTAKKEGKNRFAFAIPPPAPSVP